MANVLQPIERDLQINVGAPGWASCTVKSGERRIDVGPFSHVLTEGIDDLVRETAAIVSGAWQRTFSMDDEPQPRWQWLLKRELRGYGAARRHELDVTISRIDDLETMATNEVFRVTCDPDHFGNAVLVAARRMMSREPPAELLKRWSRFPVRATAALEAALATPEDETIG